MSISLQDQWNNIQYQYINQLVIIRLHISLPCLSHCSISYHPIPYLMVSLIRRICPFVIVICLTSRAHILRACMHQTCVWLIASHGLRAQCSHLTDHLHMLDHSMHLLLTPISHSMPSIHTCIIPAIVYSQLQTFISTTHCIASSRSIRDTVGITGIEMYWWMDDNNMLWHITSSGDHRGHAWIGWVHMHR